MAEERKKGVIEDARFRDGIWWYKVRFEDGTVAWVPEYRLERVE